MESNLTKVIKERIFDELTDSLNKLPGFSEKVKVFHKFPEEERPQRGIILRNSSANRIKMSADDFAGTLKSHLALAALKYKAGIALEWVWEDENNLTKYVLEEDVSSTLDPSRRIFKTQNKPITAGPHNTEIADNFAQIDVTVDGSKVYTEYLDGKEGLGVLPVPVPLNSVVKVSYWYKNLVPPGRYYLEMTEDNEYTITPLYITKDELVIERTTGSELSAFLANQNIYEYLQELYTKKTDRSVKLSLTNGVDYTISSNGEITFLTPLLANTRLYACYRHLGTVIGPKILPNKNYADYESLSGIVLAFGSRAVKGDSLVILVREFREPSAGIYSGHWRISLDFGVFCRDPMQLSEISDHMIDDLWRKRDALSAEGITLEELEPTGESEEVYDNNTGDIFYVMNCSLVLMSEWKRYIPYEIDIQDFSVNTSVSPQQSDYSIDANNILYQKLSSLSRPFEVKYPVRKFPKPT